MRRVRATELGVMPDVKTARQVVSILSIFAALLSTTSCSTGPRSRQTIRLDAKTQQILDSIVASVLGDEDLEPYRRRFATHETRTMVLAGGELGGIGWPSSYHPPLEGYTVFHAKRRPDPSAAPVLAARIDRFNAEEQWSFDGPQLGRIAPIRVVLMNGGGPFRNEDGTVRFLGGIAVHYVPVRTNGSWRARLFSIGK